MTAGGSAGADDPLVRQARSFAQAAHRALDQRRKYSGAPYEEHLQRVAARVAAATGDAHAVAAAWLHDVVEDTAVTHGDVERAFGAAVAELVLALTDVDRSAGNRAQRKALDRQRLAAAPAAARTVKLADLIDNAEDILRHDPAFGRVYLREMELLLPMLAGGDPGLLQEAQALHARLQQA